MVLLPHHHPDAQRVELLAPPSFNTHRSEANEGDCEVAVRGIDAILNRERRIAVGRIDLPTDQRRRV